MLFLRLLATGVSLVAAARQTSQDACQYIDSTLAGITVMPKHAAYSALSTENWSATAWGKPTCVVQPRSTADVQKIVSRLTQQRVRFAIRSGGHLPSPLGANTNDGVLIDMSTLNTKVYDAKSSTVKIGSGQRWDGVYKYLDQYNVTVVGGRVVDVGVGGLILGSGLSYLSDLHGMACDNVVNFEIVIADGSVVNANATSHEDLFKALKGGANNFGVVTSFTIRTYPIHDVWGGIRMYAHEQLPALYRALATYQANPRKDPYANLMLQPFGTNQTLGAILNLVYLKPDSSPAAFKPFSDIPSVADYTKFQTLYELLSAASQPPLPRWDWHTTSFKPSRAIYEKINSIIDTAPEVTQLSALTGGTLVLGFQPISASLVQAGLDRGGNVLGHDKVDQTWLVLDGGWFNENDDKKAHELVASIMKKIEKETKKANAYIRYQFMNDASWDQPVIDHYGTNNVRFLRQVRRKYDPSLVFNKLVTGGFKLSD